MQRQGDDDLFAVKGVEESQLALYGLCANPADAAVELVMAHALFRSGSVPFYYCVHADNALSSNPNARVVTYLLDEAPGRIQYSVFSENDSDRAVAHLLAHPGRIDKPAFNRNPHPLAVAFVRDHAAEFFRPEQLALNPSPLAFEVFASLLSLSLSRPSHALAQMMGNPHDALVDHVLAHADYYFSSAHRTTAMTTRALLPRFFGNPNDRAARFVVDRFFEGGNGGGANVNLHCLAAFAGNPSPVAAEYILAHLERFVLFRTGYHVLNSLLRNRNRALLAAVVPRLAPEDISWRALSTNPGLFVEDAEEAYLLK